VGEITSIKTSEKWWSRPEVVSLNCIQVRQGDVFLLVRIVKHWKRFPREVMECLSPLTD